MKAANMETGISLTEGVIGAASALFLGFCAFIGRERLALYRDQRQVIGDHLLRIQNLETRLTNLSDAYFRLQQDVVSREQEIVMLRGEIHGLQRELAEKDDDLAQARRRIEELETQVRELREGRGQ